MLLRLYLNGASEKINNRNSANINRIGEISLLLYEDANVPKSSTLLNKARNENMPCDIIISEFLKQINQSSNEAKQNAIKEFDEYFFQMNPKLQEEVILKLFLGDPWKTRGILHFIGGNQNLSSETESP
jgi:hypothetical protein